MPALALASWSAHGPLKTLVPNAGGPLWTSKWLLERLQVHGVRMFRATTEVHMVKFLESPTSVNLAYPMMFTPYIGAEGPYSGHHLRVYSIRWQNGGISTQI